jgi:hypothetical protein
VFGGTAVASLRHAVGQDPGLRRVPPANVVDEAERRE